MNALWHYSLCLILTVWYPSTFAGELLRTVPSIEMRGAIAVIELLAHGIVAVISVAAGWSLYSQAPHGPPLARVALIAVALAWVQSLYWTVLPTQTIPGDELPLAALALLHSGIWIAYLRHV